MKVIETKKVNGVYVPTSIKQKSDKSKTVKLKKSIKSKLSRDRVIFVRSRHFESSPVDEFFKGFNYVGRILRKFSKV